MSTCVGLLTRVWHKPNATPQGRMAYLLCIDGNVACDGAHGSEMLGPHDAARIGGPNPLTITGKDAGGHFLLLEMAAAK